MTSVPQSRSAQPLPDAIHSQLWDRIEARLARGDTLVRNRQFQVALEADYTALTGQPATTSVRRVLANAVVTISRSEPGRYVSAGVMNSARRAFERACSGLQWDSAQIRKDGPMAIARFKSHDRVRSLLDEVGLRPGAIDAEACIDHAIQVISGTRAPLERHDPTEPLVTTAPVLTVVRQETRGASAPDEDSGTAAAPDAHEGAVSIEDRPLSNEERRLGALVGRVEMRVAGSTRKVPHKLVLSPDDSGVYLLARRHPETGELEPVLRRDAPRPVVRGIDGVWRETR